MVAENKEVYKIHHKLSEDDGKLDSRKQECLEYSKERPRLYTSDISQMQDRHRFLREYGKS